ncbi:ImmA/IrrE family metallo-endopeptidase [Prosthecodimorpha staleyi]|uniref:ImmA/IrrE family metallo-endopeptidase n=1 Tax=Prosthecodimorpha staleyi TaxID=2840188 RepID=A0A947D3M1_9HYPH|nr:ImmA/IrrE family metallo-endopeptidase [Prosthecodimorpha staleyi]MBT9290400.1 ImmA/IrrE family metallo-endopeptidase [Prosthecodimorpha staleyi]
MDSQSNADWFSKPGDSVRVLMKRRGLTPAEVAGSLTDGLNTLRSILDGTCAIDEGIASALASKLGASKEFWLRRQANFDAALDRAIEVVARTECDEWLSLVPSPSGRNQQRRMSDIQLRQELRNRLVFFNVPRMDAWERRYGNTIGATRFRSSQAFASKQDATLLWLRRGEMEAELADTNKWNPEELRSCLDSIRKLTQVSHPRRFLPLLKSALAKAGVALVVVKAPPGCRASGATRMVSADKAMLLMSFRHRADDQFWFTLFHELGHLLLHQGGTFIDSEDLPGDEEIERQANAFASSCIIPLPMSEQLEELSASKNAVVRFSVSLGIAPGLTVGQMQHRGVIGHHQLNYLKRHWAWEEIEPILV